MPRCADAGCDRWRPGLGARFTGGVRLNGHWYCSRGCVESAVRQGLESPPAVAESANRLPPLRVGALLRHAEAVTQAQLEEAVLRQRQTGLRLGAQLQQLGHTSAESVLRALAAQAGISYLATVDLARVRRAPGGLPENMVRALGLLPFEADERKLHVLCTAPLPRAALRALARLTSWVPEPYFVDDDLWARALDAYQPAEEAVVHGSNVVDGIDAASAQVARAAAESGDVTVRHMACPDFVWVRLEDSSQIQDLLVQASEGERCQAAPIAL